MSQYPSLQLLEVGGMFVTERGPLCRGPPRLTWYETPPEILLFDQEVSIEASEYLPTEPDEVLIDEWMTKQRLICSEKDRSERSLLREFWRPDRGYNIAFTISFECRYSWTRHRNDVMWPRGQNYLKFDVDTRELLHRRLMYSLYTPPPHHAANEDLSSILHLDTLRYHYLILNADSPEWHSGDIDLEGQGYERPGFGRHGYFDPRRHYPGYGEQVNCCQVCGFECYRGDC